MSGLFVSFEGVEGAGKTTQITLCDRWLKSLGHKVKTTREPGGTDLGKSIREILLQGDEISHQAELMLLAADRVQHVETLIKPHLTEGYIVLCDRYTDSTIAYQGYGRGLELDQIAAINQIVTGGLQPHLTLWFDLDVQIGLTRAKQSSAGKLDRLERSGIEFHQRVEAGFKQLATQFPERIVRIDAAQSIEQIHISIKSAITNQLKL